MGRLAKLALFGNPYPLFLLTGAVAGILLCVLSGYHMLHSDAALTTLEPPADLAVRSPEEIPAAMGEHQMAAGLPGVRHIFTNVERLQIRHAVIHVPD